MNKIEQKALNRAHATAHDMENIMRQGEGGNLFPLGHCISLRDDLDTLRLWASNTNQPSLSENIAKEAQNLGRLADKAWKIFNTDRPLSKRDGETTEPTEEGFIVFEFEEVLKTIVKRLNSLMSLAGDPKETEKPKETSQKTRDKRSESGKKGSGFWRDDKEIRIHDHRKIKERFKKCREQGLTKNAAAVEVARLLNEDALIDNKNYLQRHIQTRDAYPVAGKDAVLSFMGLKDKKSREKAIKENPK